MRAVLYLRVSTLEQVGNLSLDTQEKACRDYCTRNGLEVDRVFREEGESAKTTDRTQLRAMLAYLERAKTKIDQVVIYDLSRLSRDTLDTLLVQKHLQGLGIGVRAATQPIDNSPEGAVLGTVLSAVNQFENELRRRKVIAGMREALTRGRWPWHAPVGYVNRQSDDGREKWIEPDPATAPLIRLAFERAATGALTRPEILKEVRSRGLHLPKTTLDRILCNPLYAGRILVPRWAIDVAAAHKPLVDWKTFRCAAGEERPTRPYVTGSTATFPFRQITRCAVCGRPLAGYWARGRSARYPYYRCMANHCAIRAEKMSQAFERLLESLATPPPIFDLFEATLRDLIADRQRQHKDLAAAARRRIASTRSKLERLTEAYLYEGGIDRTTYQDQQTKLGTMLRDLEAQEAEAATKPLGQFEPALRFGREMLLTPLLSWDRLKVEQRPIYLRTVFPAGLEWTPERRFSNPRKSLLFLPLQDFCDRKARVVPPTGFEPVTSALKGTIPILPETPKNKLSPWSACELRLLPSIPVQRRIPLSVTDGLPTGGFGRCASLGTAA